MSKKQEKEEEESSGSDLDVEDYDEEGEGSEDDETANDITRGVVGGKYKIAAEVANKGTALALPGGGGAR